MGSVQLICQLLPLGISGDFSFKAELYKKLLIKKKMFCDTVYSLEKLTVDIGVIFYHDT